ncbi:error-prone DNA polymerase [Alsobacter soli]|uniref:Error-prone DNA polymerase n=1 Tax=Alsobacter soli TaxID=2109933 RepID=A0A2T1HYI2_9HYPH|nr:error-prone DNA polymerase [Alsobacter soli]PSC06753.1 error-prone DNA polymerase [Alsobacter soli]
MNARASTPYAELVAATNFSFLRGASHAEHMLLTSLLLGHTGLGIADRNTVAGVVRAFAALKDLREGGVLPPLKRRIGGEPGCFSVEPFPLPDALAGTAPLSPPSLRAEGEATQERSAPGLSPSPLWGRARGGDLAPDHDGSSGPQPQSLPTRGREVGRAPHESSTPLGLSKGPWDPNRPWTDDPAQPPGYAWPDPPDPPEPEPPVIAEWAEERAQTFRLVTGARLVFTDGTPDIVVHPADRAGWGRLCRILTEGSRRAKKGECLLTLDDLLADARGLLLVVSPGRDLRPLPGLLPRLNEAAPGAVWLGATMHRRGDERRRLARLKALADAARLPLLATNDALYADPSDRELQDILSCIREGVTIETAGRLLEANAERHLKPPAEMARLFRDCPQAIAETQALLERVEFSLDQLRYEYPDEPTPPGRDSQDWLEELTWRSAEARYPSGVPAKVQTLLRDELALIGKLDYARYFLTIHDIVRVARDKGILCQGRGSAANSAVCYVLGITAVDPNEHNVLFARFISEERREPPDIDVDFEHERREEVIQHIYEKYGRHRAGIAATVIHYRPKSAIREAGKALGLSEDVTAALSGTQWGSWGSDITRNQVQQAGLDPDNPEIRRAVDFAKRLLGFPRHLSQHVGGFVLTRGRLDELVPIGNAAMPDRTFIEWDKDDIDTLGLMKVDVLALGMLTCIRKAFELLGEHEGLELGLADVPGEDVATYDMLCKGDSIGVFQVESRAQINMLPRLKPRTFYDLVIEVAIVRPGPIQGNMVHPYLRRRAGLEEVTFPSPAPEHGPADELRNVLGKTMGVPLFQEQAMQLAMVAAQFSDKEANQLRRAISSFRHVGTVHLFEAMMVERMLARGYEREFAQSCFEQIKGFGSYGFPESHAASFAKLVYVSSWIKRHYPAVFTCALLNSQPMGFYAPAQLVRDAREHGVEVRPVDVNASLWDNTLERRPDGALALRLGFRQADGVHEAEAMRLVRVRGPGYSSVEELSVRAGLYGRPMRALADADAFRSIGLDRRAALWEVRRLPQDEPLPLFAAASARELAEEPDARLPEMSLGEHVASDYQTLRLSLKGHPMGLLRDVFRRERALTCAETAAQADARFVRVAGVVLVRQRPGNGNAIFITIEDETGITNVMLWARQFEPFRRAVMMSRLMLVEGRVQKSPEGVVHVMASAIFDRSPELDRLWSRPRQEPAPAADPKPVKTYVPAALHLAPPSRSANQHPRDVRVLPKSRDFH